MSRHPWKSTCAIGMIALLPAFPARGSDGASGSSSIAVGVGFDWKNEEHPGGVPSELEMTISVDYSGSCATPNGGPCNPPDPKWKLTLYDCEKRQMWSTSKGYAVGCGDSGDDELFKELALRGRLPRFFKLEKYSGTVSRTTESGDCHGDPGWTDNGFQALPDPGVDCGAQTPYGDDWQSFRRDLQRLVCRTGTIPDRQAAPPHEGFKFYKTARGGLVLYTLPASTGAAGASDPRYGEVVNSLFVPPNDGFLLLEVEDNTGSVVEVVNLGDRHCQELSMEQEYAFDTRTLRGRPTGDFVIRLNWYGWEVEPTGERCCLERLSRDLELDVREMCAATVDPLLPRRARLHKGPGEAEIVGYEVRIPTCGTQDCPGNLTQWFVLWPGSENSLAVDGFAKGWKFQGNTLKAPGDDGMEYVFSE